MAYLVGIDEVGRGPLAGPVTVVALAMPSELRIKNYELGELRDSKMLTEKKRKEWFGWIAGHPQMHWAAASVYPKAIDKINIFQAANRAATRAVRRLIEKQKVKISNILLDGSLYLRPIKINNRIVKLKARTVIGGDEKYNCIKLASIVAKVKRDNLLKRYHKKFPQYGLEEHKGYGTKRHIRAIKKFGPSAIHRLTFIKNFVRV